MSTPIAPPYIRNYEQLGLGLFVHWGLYSQLGRGEWVYDMEKMNMQEYQKLKEHFTAKDFDAEDLVLTAKKAGCRYITLTTRHHEGFSLYDTCGLNDFDAPHSPAKRDLVLEFVESCRRHDILPFFYHTTLDWYQPDFEHNFHAYLAYLRRSIEILCTRYGRIGGFWFDGNWSKPDANWQEEALYATIRHYQPEAIIVNNTGLSALGETGNPEIDVVTFEQGQPTPLDREGMSKYVAAEMCQTMNDHWGYAKQDLHFKSPKELIETLCHCRKVGANYLLNIGPDAQGGIPLMSRAMLETIGDWMHYFGEAIYNGRPYPASGIGKNFILRHEKTLYLFVFDPGRRGNENVTVGTSYSGSYAFGNVKDAVSSIQWMDNGEPLDFVQKGEMLCVDFSGQDYGKSFGVRVAKAQLA